MRWFHQNISVPPSSAHYFPEQQQSKCLHGWKMNNPEWVMVPISRGGGFCCERTPLPPVFTVCGALQPVWSWHFWYCFSRAVRITYHALTELFTTNIFGVGTLEWVKWTKYRQAHSPNRDQGLQRDILWFRFPSWLNGKVSACQCRRLRR